MTAIDAVLFDYGGVFTASPFAAAGHYGREHGVDPDLLVRTIFGPYDEDTDHPWHRLERGEITLGDASAEIQALGLGQGIEAHPLGFFSAMATLASGIHENMQACARSLYQSGYRTALVTNNAAEFREHWRKSLPLEDLFHTVVDSSEVGVRKPDPRIFEIALERLGGVEPERAVLLDDFEGNVEAARRLGMKAVLVGVDPDDALGELERVLGTFGA